MFQNNNFILISEDIVTCKEQTLLDLSWPR